MVIILYGAHYLIKLIGKAISSGWVYAQNQIPPEAEHILTRYINKLLD